MQLSCVDELLALSLRLTKPVRDDYYLKCDFVQVLNSRLPLLFETSNTTSLHLTNANEGKHAV